MNTPPNTATLNIGAVLKNGTYRVESLLGQGGFGITYLIRHVSLGKQMVLKEFFMRGYSVRNTDSTVGTQSIDIEDYNKYKEKFLEEAQLLAKFSGHPNIVDVTDHFEENNTAYFVMPFLKAVNLSAYCNRQPEGKISEKEALRIAKDVASALIEIHTHNVLHRDLKPDNILITDKGTSILIDFGAAREFISQEAQKHSVLLTHGYAPIEQYNPTAVRGNYTDIYAFGATLYRILTGVLPVSAPSRTLEVLQPPQKLNPSISTTLNDVLMKAMALRPDERFQRVEDMMAAWENPGQKSSFTLETLLSEPETMLAPPTPSLKDAADALFHKGKYTEAHRIYLQLIRQNPADNYLKQQISICEDQHIKTLRKEADAHFDRKAYADAAAWYEKILLIRKTDEWAISQHQKCQSALTKSVEKPKSKAADIGAMRKQAHLLFNKKQYAEAIPAYERILQILPNDAEAKRQIAKCKERLTPPAKKGGFKKVAAFLGLIGVLAGGAMIGLHPEWFKGAKYGLVQKATPEMQYVKGGFFLMGSKTADTEADTDEKPQHSVKISSFYIAKTEVTFAQYKAFCDATNRPLPPMPWGKQSDMPITNVSQADAMAYCEWLSKKTGQKYKLPTEAQWEYAARGGEGGKMYKYSGSNNINEVAWSINNSGDRPQPVATLIANGLDIYDMSGNVWEWCRDGYEANFYIKSPLDNPCNGPKKNGLAVLRGGSYHSYTHDVRVADRLEFQWDKGDKKFGFRVVREL